ATGTEFVVPRAISVNAYEPVGNVLESYQEEVYTYDAYGNVTQKDSLASNLPTVSAIMHYLFDPTFWILDRIDDVTTTSVGASGNYLKTGWTGKLLTAIHQWVDMKPGTGCGAMTTGSCVETSMAYASDGDLQSVTEPNTGDGRTRTTLIAN